MRRFRSLLIERAELRMPGLQVLSFALHRHLVEHASVDEHRHGWSQAIVYLSGAGEQTVGRRRARVGAGSLVLLPPQVSHAFVRRNEHAPLCVMVEFRLRGARAKPPVVCSLSRSELLQLRQHVAHLLRLHRGTQDVLRWEGAVPVLQVLLTLLRAAGWIERVADSPRGPRQNSAVASLLGTLGPAGSLSDAVRRSGYHRDHLNRLVKQETGLTLGQYRAQQRLAKAKELLASGVQVAHAGAAVGLADQSYFARWFRRQTGQTPSSWSAHEAGNQ